MTEKHLMFIHTYLPPSLYVPTQERTHVDNEFSFEPGLCCLLVPGPGIHSFTKEQSSLLWFFSVIFFLTLSRWREIAEIETIEAKSLLHSFSQPLWRHFVSHKPSHHGETFFKPSNLGTAGTTFFKVLPPLRLYLPGKLVIQICLNERSKFLTSHGMLPLLVFYHSTGYFLRRNRRCSSLLTRLSNVFWPDGA